MRKNDQHKEAFGNFLDERNLRKTNQRNEVLKALLAAGKHISADDLYAVAKSTMPTIGYATVFRNIKLLCESGLAQEIKIGKKSFYEAKPPSGHHDHLICLQCGSFTEFYDEEMEKLQTKIATAKEFRILRHKMEIYGFCKKCRCAKTE